MRDSLEKDVEAWLKYDSDPASRAAIRHMAKNDRQRLARVMQPRIAFGTAGLRAEMGPGFALMNSVTVTQTSQGLARYAEATMHNAKKRGVVIGHDHRHNSKQFAEDIARTFSHAGFELHFLAEVHTPMVPFAISQLKAACGVMVTASHNPAKDNGYKVYWENACQIIAPHDKGIADHIDANLDLWNTKLPKLSTTDLSTEYVEVVMKPLLNGAALNPQFKIVYTPMHGVGLPPTKACFQLLGCEHLVTVVPEQACPDPDFPTVDFPNPEERGALDLAMAKADEVGATVVLANDPDADRFTCAVREAPVGCPSKWRQLTGDQIGALFTDYILEQCKGSADKPVAVVSSTVSSRRMKAQAERSNAEYFETLTGFKWICNKAIDLEAKGYTVPFAYEEAIGYMVGGHAVKDKDGVSALLVFVQLLCAIYDAESTVYAKLDEISKTTGYFATHNSYFMVSAPSVTTSTFAKIRTLSKDYVGDLKVTAWRDLTTGYDSSQPDHCAILPVSPSSEMLTVELEFSTGEKARLTARGSGTEPKLKVYIEASAKSEQEAQAAANRVWDTLASEWFSNL